MHIRQRRIQREQREKIRVRIDRRERVRMTDPVRCTEDQGANVQRAVQRQKRKVFRFDLGWRSSSDGSALENGSNALAKLVQNWRFPRIQASDLVSKRHA